MNNIVTLGTPTDRMAESHQKAWGEKPPGEQVPGETPPSVRTIARQQEVDLQTLVSILSYRRPDQSQTESDFVEIYLDGIEGMMIDKFGNRYLEIGEKPHILWSCHTDTVSKEDGMQNVKWDGDFLKVNDPKQGQTLGADDGAGLWLMLEMIKAGQPGLYVFHRGEEVGCLGSGWIAKHHKETKFLDGIKIAIAFDRKGTDSVITRQRGNRGCSDEFGNALAAKLNQIEGLSYKLDPTGVYTDTAEYDEIVPECTNLSVGYYSEHTSSEKLDVRHLLRLRQALVTLDFSDLPVKREPGDNDYQYSNYSYGSGGFNSNWTKSTLERIEDYVELHPEKVAKMLYQMGFTEYTLTQCISNVSLRANGGVTTLPAQPKPAETKLSTDEAEEVWRKNLWEHLERQGEKDPDDKEEASYDDLLWCNDCNDFDEQTAGHQTWPGDQCSQCLGRDTEVYECVIDNTTGEVRDVV